MTTSNTTLLLFTPQFLTNAGVQVATVNSGQTVALQTPFNANSVTQGFGGETFVYVGAKITEPNAQVVRHPVGGSSVVIPAQYEMDDQFLYWSANVGVQNSDTIEVTYQQPSFVNVSLLTGSLPPGLSIDGHGLISGRVGAIAEATTYNFALRLSCDGNVRDREFVFAANAEVTYASFNPTLLQPSTTETVGSGTITYRDLGSVDRGRGYAFTLDILNTGGLSPDISITPMQGSVAGGSVYEGLPDNLAVVETTIQGVIDPAACPGRYYFTVNVNDAAHAQANFVLTVNSEFSKEVGVIPQVLWDTTAGDLGSIVESEPSYLQVSAHTLAITDSLTYSVAPGSALPAGLTISSITGRIYGLMPFVDSDTTFTFTLRAQAGLVFADRIFSITVLNWFDINSIHQLSLKLRLLDEVNLVPLYQQIIDGDQLFRPEDSNFGLLDHPYVYLITGLDGTVDLDTALTPNTAVTTNYGTIQEQNTGLPVNPQINRLFESRFKLVLGPHKIAQARSSNGAVIYDVLYRELYDPMAKAGGFTLTEGSPVEMLPRWPQSGPLKRFIYPTSVTNIRQDLVSKVGLAMTDPTERTVMYGTDSHELLPLWMRTEQTSGDPSSVPGFQAVLLIGYINPANATVVADNLAKAIDIGSQLTPTGHVYHFDEIFTTASEMVEETQFDNQPKHQLADGTTPAADPTTSFISVGSDDSIVFDEIDGDIVKYLE